MCSENTVKSSAGNATSCVTICDGVRTVSNSARTACGEYFIYVSLRLRVQNAVPAQPCVGKLGISLVLLNFLHCNFRLWFKTP